uniref:uncharacterized protein n=1 Tax=Semicossyphus pulcher TaxID=241346 RepID=UPI0037E754D0
MRRSTTQPAAQIEKWTEEDVHRWLTTEVKVHESCADRFVEEEVSGDSLVAFTKTDILDLGIKHGPAVKIISYLKSLKDGSQRDQFPAYVEHWTKEQVNQWLLQHVTVYSKYAERLQEEDVSGDYLVCFKKQDFLDLEVKSGPAVKILAKLSKLTNNPEPTLQPIAHTSTEPKEAPNTNQPEVRLAQTVATNQPQPCNTTESETGRMVGNESGKVQQPLKKDSEEETQHPKPQNSGARRKENNETPALRGVSKITMEIQKTLDDLLKEDFKRFHFYLKQYTKSKYEPIPQSKLEGRDTMDTAKLMTDHYESKEALRVTLEILREIGQSELALQLENNVGKKTNV